MNLNDSVKGFFKLYPAKTVLYVGTWTARLFKDNQLFGANNAVLVSPDLKLGKLPEDSPYQAFHGIIFSDSEGTTPYYTANFKSESGLLKPELLQPILKNLKTESETQRAATTLDAFVSTLDNEMVKPDTINWLCINSFEADRILNGADELLKSLDGVIVRILHNETGSVDLLNNTTAHLGEQLEHKGFMLCGEMDARVPLFGYAVFVRNWKAESDQARTHFEAMQEKLHDQINSHQAEIQKLSEKKSTIKTLEANHSKLQKTLKGHKERIASMALEKIQNAAELKAAEESLTFKKSVVDRLQMRVAELQRGQVDKDGFIFISGSPRSGTSALTQLLNGLDHVKLGMEMYPDLLDEGDVNGVLPRLGDADDILRRLSKKHKGERLEQELAAFASCRITGDKHPHYHRFFPELDIHFGNPVQVFIFREIVGVAISFENRFLDENDAWELEGFHAFTYWVQAAENFLAFYKQHPERAVAISFENLFVSGYDDGKAYISDLTRYLGKFYDVGNMDPVAVDIKLKKGATVKARDTSNHDEAFTKMLAQYKERYPGSDMSREKIESLKKALFGVEASWRGAAPKA